MLRLFALLLSLTAAAPSSPLDVPYLPQTGDLCGGAAAAMVFRYWGDAHAAIAPFAGLVDRDAHGIATNALVASVRAKGWNVVEYSGKQEVLAGELSFSHPVIALLEDRPDRYHYVVAVGVNEQTVTIHDPTWGPYRVMPRAKFLAAWNAANAWAMVILPKTEGDATTGDSKRVALRRSGADPQESAVGRPVQGRQTDASDCDLLLERAVARIRSSALDDAEAVLNEVAGQCPDSAAPIAELAGVSFAKHRWADAESQAERALERDPSNAYAWDVLGSSRYMRDDPIGALEAWNHVNKPVVDRVVIEGLRRSRYALVAQALSISPNELLTPERFMLARDRLRELPDQTHTRIDYRPGPDGFATVNVAIVERTPTFKATSSDWVETGARAAVEREAALVVPDASGQGGLWRVDGRWWDNRPRVGVSFAAPRVGALPGILRVEGGWQAETFATSFQGAPGADGAAAAVVREERFYAAVSFSTRLIAGWKHEVTIGGDSWTSLTGNDRRLFAGVRIERTAMDGRLTLSASAQEWPGAASHDAFGSHGVRVELRSSTETSGFVAAVQTGIEGVRGQAPLSLWPGAGEGRARPQLLRAHPLLVGGVIQNSASFGRQLGYVNVEAVLWRDKPLLPRVGFAVFTDSARVWSPLAPSPYPLQIDSGAGVRVRLPGSDNVFRIDYARGMRDGRRAVTVGFTSSISVPHGSAIKSTPSSEPCP